MQENPRHSTVMFLRSCFAAPPKANPDPPHECRLPADPSDSTSTPHSPSHVHSLHTTTTHSDCPSIPSTAENAFQSFNRRSSLSSNTSKVPASSLDVAPILRSLLKASPPEPVTKTLSEADGHKIITHSGTDGCLASPIPEIGPLVEEPCFVISREIRSSKVKSKILDRGGIVRRSKWLFHSWRRTASNKKLLISSEDKVTPNEVAITKRGEQESIKSERADSTPKPDVSLQKESLTFNFPFAERKKISSFSLPDFSSLDSSYVAATSISPRGPYFTHPLPPYVVFYLPSDGQPSNQENDSSDYEDSKCNSRYFPSLPAVLSGQNLMGKYDQRFDLSCTIESGGYTTSFRWLIGGKLIEPNEKEFQVLTCDNTSCIQFLHPKPVKDLQVECIVTNALGCDRTAAIVSILSASTRPCKAAYFTRPENGFLTVSAPLAGFEETEKTIRPEISDEVFNPDKPTRRREISRAKPRWSWILASSSNNYYANTAENANVKNLQKKELRKTGQGEFAIGPTVVQKTPESSLNRELYLSSSPTVFTALTTQILLSPPEISYFDEFLHQTSQQSVESPPPGINGSGNNASLTYRSTFSIREFWRDSTHRLQRMRSCRYMDHNLASIPANGQTSQAAITTLTTQADVVVAAEGKGDENKGRNEMLRQISGRERENRWRPWHKDRLICGQMSETKPHSLVSVSADKVDKTCRRSSRPVLLDSASSLPQCLAYSDSCTKLVASPRPMASPTNCAQKVLSTGSLGDPVSTSSIRQRRPVLEKVSAWPPKISVSSLEVAHSHSTPHILDMENNQLVDSYKNGEPARRFLDRRDLFVFWQLRDTKLQSASGPPAYLADGSSRMGHKTWTRNRNSDPVRLQGADKHPKSEQAEAVAAFESSCKQHLEQVVPVALTSVSQTQVLQTDQKVRRSRIEPIHSTYAQSNELCSSSASSTSSSTSQALSQNKNRQGKKEGLDIEDINDNSASDTNGILTVAKRRELFLLRISGSDRNSSYQTRNSDYAGYKGSSNNNEEGKVIPEGDTKSKCVLRTVAPKLDMKAKQE